MREFLAKSLLPRSASSRAVHAPTVLLCYQQMPKHHDQGGNEAIPAMVPVTHGRMKKLSQAMFRCNLHCSPSDYIVRRLLEQEGNTVGTASVGNPISPRLFDLMG
jgi:hypothetical protein